MPRNAGAFVENSFIKGLITEATGLNFPENAVVDTDNCVFDETGRVSRRFGIDFETGHVLRTIDRDDCAVAHYRWKAAAGSGTLSFAVSQVGSTIYFYQIDDYSISAKYKGSISLTPFLASGAPSPSTKICQFAEGNGYLFVAHPYCETIYIEYDTDFETFTANQIDLLIRDFEGVEDGLEIDERPADVDYTDLHKYNLYNQGWYPETIRIAPGDDGQALTDWQSKRSDNPSNADVWWLYKDGSEQFDPARLRVLPGNSPAPKGHYTLNPYYQDRSDASDVAGIEVTSSRFYRASSVAFFAGRVWYSGVEGTGYSNNVYYSQIIERESQFGWCFQQNDPTSENKFDLIDSDGGVLSILDAGKIIKLFPVENSIIIFATNGVWQVTGSTGTGFKATDFSVNKLSSVKTLSGNSFVSISGLPAWWGEDGIYAISSDASLGSLQVQSLTDEKIKRFYEAIPTRSKFYACGDYNPVERIIQWCYSPTAGTGTTSDYEFSRILNLNVLTGAFYPWTVDDDVKINGIIAVDVPSMEGIVSNVVDASGNQVVDASANTVIAKDTEEAELGFAFKYFCSYSNGAGSYITTFADEHDLDFVDWAYYNSLAGDSYSSYIVSGYKVHGDAQRKFQPNYVYIYSEKGDTPSVFDFSARWNYANSGSTGRWSQTQRLTYPDTDFDYQKKKVKVRGHGVAVQFYFASVAGEPMNLIGWSTFETANASI